MLFCINSFKLLLSRYFELVTIEIYIHIYIYLKLRFHLVPKFLNERSKIEISRKY